MREAAPLITRLPPAPFGRRLLLRTVILWVCFRFAAVFGGNEQVPFDEEAFEYWRSETDIDEQRILRFDAKDLPQHADLLDRMPAPYVIDHMARVDAAAGLDQEPDVVAVDGLRSGSWAQSEHGGADLVVLAVEEEPPPPSAQPNDSARRATARKIASRGRRRSMAGRTSSRLRTNSVGGMPSGCRLRT